MPDDILTGGEAIGRLLSNIDVPARIAQIEAQLPHSRGDKLSKLHRELKYLQAIRDSGLTPDRAYMLTKLPVLPARYRPIYPDERGKLVVSALNKLYKDVGAVNDQLKTGESLPDPVKRDLAHDLYKGTAAVFGLSDPISFGQDAKGIFEQVAGSGSPKGGFFQDKVVRRRQNISGRTVISIDPSLGMDEVGLPEEMAWEQYKPFVIRKLVGAGHSVSAARKEVEARSPIAKAALEDAMEERPVQINRAPSLHKFSIMSMIPKLVPGRDLKTNPLVLAGFGADFDGDSCCGTMVYEKQFSINVIDIGEFPRVETSSEMRPSGIVIFDVPKDIRVFAIGSITGKPGLFSVTQYSVHPNLQMYNVRTRRKRTAIVSEDHSLFTINPVTLILEKSIPSESINRLMPYPKKLPLSDSIDNLPMGEWKNTEGRSERIAIADSVPVGFSLGHFLGCMIGNGWVDVRLSLAENNDVLVNKFIAEAHDLFSKNLHFARRVTENTIDGDRKFKSSKLTYSSATLVRFVKYCIGQGAENKHLPPFYLHTREEFRYGLISGLLDTDGCITKFQAASKKKSQISISYTTKSKRLSEEIPLLFRSLGIAATSTVFERRGIDYYQISISVVDIATHVQNITLTTIEDMALLHELAQTKFEDSSTGKQDIVPITATLRRQLKRMVGASKHPKSPEEIYQRNLYAAIHAGNGYSITRRTAQLLIARIGRNRVRELPNGEQWLGLVENEDILWDTVEEVEARPGRETGYDLTVPGANTFMLANQVVVWDSMAVHVPLSEQARREAFNMLPSRHLFKPGTYLKGSPDDTESYSTLMPVPGQAAVLGLYLLSKPRGNSKGTFKDDTDALLALRDGKISAEDAITIDGKTTTAGRILIKQHLPTDMHDFDVLHKGALEHLLARVAVHQPKDFPRVAQSLRELGDNYATERGFSIGLDDLEPMSGKRDLLLRKADEAVRRAPSGQRGSVLARVYGQVGKSLEDMQATKDDNPMVQMVLSGSRGKAGQVRQILGAPLLVEDSRDRIIPIPIRRSYSEGLDPQEYWAASYGVRKGMVGRSQQTALPGALAKELLASVVDSVVATHDHPPEHGDYVELPLDRTHDVVDRYLHSDAVDGKGGVVLKKNQLLTSDLIPRLRKAGVRAVRLHTPMNSELHGGGISAKSFGLNERGKLPDVGDNIGLLAGHAITEPISQMTLKSFHTAGLAGAGKNVPEGFDRIKQLLELPEVVKAKATLAEEDGPVEKVEPAPAGGHHVHILGTSHYVPQDRSLLVKAGDAVSKGDRLSDGVIKPQELLRLRGLRATQEHLVEELQRNMGGTRRKYLEAIVGSMTNMAHVDDPGDHDDHVPGDVIPAWVARHHNANLKREVPLEDALGKIHHTSAGPQEITQDMLDAWRKQKRSAVQVELKPMTTTPVLKGVNVLPLIKAQDNWLAGMDYRRLKDVLQEGALRGRKAEKHSYNPVPAYAVGQEFGLGEKGKY